MCVCVSAEGEWSIAIRQQRLTELRWAVLFAQVPNNVSLCAKPVPHHLTPYGGRQLRQTPTLERKSLSLCLSLALVCSVSVFLSFSGFCSTIYRLWDVRGKSMTLGESFGYISLWYESDNACFSLRWATETDVWWVRDFQDRLKLFRMEFSRNSGLKMGSLFIVFT